VRDVAESVRPAVRESLAPTPLFPYRRINPPTMHAQLYAGIETSGRPVLHPERDGVLYLHLYAKREEDLDALYAAVDWLDGHRAMGAGGDRLIHYRLASATLLEEDDGTLHKAVLYSTRYYRF
jgi:hypothetical protein